VGGEGLFKKVELFVNSSVLDSFFSRKRDIQISHKAICNPYLSSITNSKSTRMVNTPKSLKRATDWSFSTDSNRSKNTHHSWRYSIDRKHISFLVKVEVELAIPFTNKKNNSCPRKVVAPPGLNSAYSGYDTKDRFSVKHPAFFFQTIVNGQDETQPEQ
jgi:hypothetical protein